MICRIHNKTGDKRNQLQAQGHGHGQGQQGNFLLQAAEAASSKTGCLPPLLECQSQSTQNPSFLQNPRFVQIQEADLMKRHNQDHHQLFQPSSSSSSSSSSAAALQSMLFKSLLFSHPDQAAGTSNTPTTTSAPKQCKTEASVNISHVQTPPLNSNAGNFSYLMEKNHSHLSNGPDSLLQYHYPRNPLFFEDFHYYNGLLGLSTSCTAETETSSSVGGFNRAGFQTMLDPLIKLPAAESWNLDIA